MAPAGEVEDPALPPSRNGSSNNDEKRKRLMMAAGISSIVLILIIIIIVVVVLTLPKGTPSSSTADADGWVPVDIPFEDPVGDALGDITTTPLDEYIKGECDFSGQVQPHILSQCECTESVSILAQDIQDLYQRLVQDLVPLYYSPEEWQQQVTSITSCDPRNQALLWLSSGDTRRSGNVGQRFVVASLYVEMHGTDWDYRELWLSDHNECQWQHLQCNDKYQINSFVIETANLFGTVRTIVQNNGFEASTIFILFLFLLFVQHFVRCNTNSYLPNWPCYKQFKPCTLRGII